MNTRPETNLRKAFSSTCWKPCAALLLAIATLAAQPVQAQQQYGPPATGASAAVTFAPATLNLVAGLNGAGYGGDGGLANSSTTKLQGPIGLGYNASGDLFIADQENEVVRRIDHTTGDISTFAGNNQFGSSAPAPNAQATTVSLGYVSGLAVDKNNNVYFADRSNHVIWKVATTGVITIFAGTIGDAGYTGDGSAATAATLNSPWGIVFDAAGNLYISDIGNHLVRSIDTSGNIHTFAGSGTFAGSFSCPAAYSGDGGLATAAALCSPYGITSDAAGNIYISDYTFAVVKVVHTDGTIHPFAGDGAGTNGDMGDGGAATAANLWRPFGLYTDPGGNIYIVDQFGNTIRQVNAAGIIETVFGIYGGDLTKTSIGEPDNEAVTVGVGPADGIYYITMDKFGDLLEVDSAGATVTSAGSVGQYVFGEIAPYTTSAIAYVTVINPSGVALAFTGTPTITGTFNIVTGTGAGTCNLSGSLAAGGSCTIGITFSPTVGGIPGTLVTGSIVLTSNSNTSPNTINLSGTGYGTVTYTGTLTGPPSGFTSPVGVTSASQQATLTNTGNPPITISSTAFASGGTKGFAVSSTTCPTSPATLAAGASCVFNITFTPAAQTSYNDQFEVDIANYGDVLANVSGTGTAAQPTPVSGPQLQFVPAEVNLFAGTGVLCSDTGDGGPALSATLCTVTSVAVDQVGNTYIVDQGYNTVRKVDKNGNISAFAGVPVHAGFNQSSGDGGAATAAYIDVPTDVAVDPSGNVYIAEANASKIRKVDVTTGTITTFVGGAPGNFKGGTGAGVALGEPIGIAFDPSGNLYIGTFGQFVVIKVTPAGVATALAGTGTAGYNGDNIQATTAELANPLYVASDLAGNIYIEDGNSNSLQDCRIRKVTASTGLITSVAGTGPCATSGDGGPAASAEVYLNFGPFGLDLAGDIFFNTVNSASTSSVIRKIDVLGNISTIIGNGATEQSGYPVSGTNTFFEGLASARIDNYGNLLLPIVIPNNQNYPDEVAVSGSTGILQFGNQNVGTTSAPLTVTLENTGSSSLTLSQTTYTATGNFAVSGGTCVSLSTLASGATCTLTVTFSPLSAGPLTGAISVGSNAAGGTASVVLQGTGVGAAVTLTPATVPFGNQTVSTTSAAQTVTLSNTGSATLTSIEISLTGTNPSDFATSATTCGTSLAAGANCTISVTFTPASATSFTATLSVADSDTSSPQTSSLTGTGTVAAAPIAALSPTTVTFGNQTVSTTSTAQTVTLSNTGNASLTGIAISLTGTNPGDFADTSACGTTLAAGASCNISVTFTPATAASFAATLSVADNATGSPQTASLTGTGTAAPAPIASLSPTTVAFGSQTVSTTSTAQTVTLSNTGNATLTGIAISLTGANPGDFAATSGCGTTLAAGASCNISVTFTPATVASFAATVSVTDNATGSPQTSSLTGTGTAVQAPIATLSPSAVTFAATQVGTSSAMQTLTLTNSGNASLAIGSVSLGGTNPSEFADTSTCGSSLAAGASCTIAVTFTPDSANSFTAVVSVADNASGSPQTTTLNGTGLPAATDFGLAATPPTLSVPAGGVAQFALNLTGIGGNFNSPVVLTVTGVPAGSSASFSPATVVPGSTAASVLSVATPSLMGALLAPSGSAPGAGGSHLPLLALLLLPLLGFRKARKRFASWPRVKMMTIGLLAIAALVPLSGCGGGYFGDKPQTVTLTITGTSGALQHSTSVTLTIQ